MHSMEEMTRSGCTSRRGVRFWEEKGLLGVVARDEKDDRRFTDEQLERARIIAAAQFGAFDLEAIAGMIAEYHTSPEAREAILTRMSDQIRAAARLAENLPVSRCVTPGAVEYDL